MPADLLKFRCYRCNQLLAVAPSKVGAIVACPKCKADLVVPGGIPAQGGTATPNEGSRRGRARSQRSALEIGVAQFSRRAVHRDPARCGRPAARGFTSRSRVFRATDAQAAGSEPSTRPPSVPEPVLSNFAPPPPIPTPIPEIASPMRPPEVFSVAAEPVDITPRLAPTPPAFAPVDSVVPPIEIETSSLRTPATEPRIIHEVILPAAVVLAWSVFVLAAIALSFLAGLLVGHFLWRTP